jgi:exodeoxyribonuclease V beta subunit
VSASRSIAETALPFDALAASLEGTQLIEANAGTGKTWTIAALYVRLLLETDCEADSILVVTFTEAAAGELRDRIRSRIVETHAAFASGSAAREDPFTAALLARASDRGKALLKLTTALRDFDQAPVYTIHAFCQRVLSDRAFEAGLPFRTEIVPDQSAILREIAEDFWRREMHDTSPLFARFLAAGNISPESLLDENVERALARPYLEIRGPAGQTDFATVESEFEEACAAARAIWHAEREAIGRALTGSTGLHATRYRKESIPLWLDEMHSCLSAQSAQITLCKSFDKFTRETLRAATNRNGRTPEHPFFEACERLKSAHGSLLETFDDRLTLLRVRLIEYCERELACRKERRQLQSYDDLLMNVARALGSEHGSSFAAVLRERYRAALIDEFQDTDPLQYGIFRSIYGGADSPLFLVGDPKQAIYSFRGADVYTYIGARPDACNAYTLTVNWRSTEPLLTAVNRIFDNAPNPFAIPEIGFRASQAAPGDRGRLVIEGEEMPPFTLWLLESANAKSINKGEAASMARDATAAEIARLLELGKRGLARIEEGERTRPLCGGDIAVLVRSHRQGAAVREALAKLGIASVQRGSSSVFATHEAGELQRILAAVAEPGREVLIGAALTTDMIGYTGEELFALRSDEKLWDEIAEGFRAAHREWHDNGFVRMLRGFMKRHRMLVRLLEHRDGERRATNLLHLTELLHNDAERHGIGGLLAWLEARRRSPEEGNEPELLRLESDENLVKILTVHVAKGLEFPLVFCPFVWDGNLRMADSKVIRFHEPAAANRSVVDFGSASFADSRPQAVLEERAENLRLLYVALTRARYRSWMVWGSVKDAESSAPAWLLHRGTQPEDPRAAFAHDIQLETRAMQADLDRLAKRSEGNIGVLPLSPPQGEPLAPAADGGATLAPRTFSARLRDTGAVTSFTALAHARTIEAPDYDAADRELEEEHGGGTRDIARFPRGARAGKCLHAILEQIDFRQPATVELETVVAKELAAHGFEASWLQPVAGMVQSVVDTPLDATGMRLSGISRRERMDELEFYYPIASLSDRGLRRILAASGFPDAIRETFDTLTFMPVQGYMRGFIDLVFEHRGRYYLADYKSNWVGPSVTAYDQDALATLMGREAYHLQYLVYCVALHRYLGARLRGYSYESHFGGVRYLFLRGMTPRTGAGYGVYADRPSVEVVSAMDDYLRNGSA